MSNPLVTTDINGVKRLPSGNGGGYGVVDSNFVVLSSLSTTHAQGIAQAQAALASAQVAIDAANSLLSSVQGSLTTHTGDQDAHGLSAVRANLTAAALAASTAAASLTTHTADLDAHGLNAVRSSITAEATARTTVDSNLSNQISAISKSSLGLSNVQNVDQTNASNLLSGTVPTGRLPLATTVANGALAYTDKLKLNSITSGATANQTDAYLLNRSNHTGTQSISTIDNLTTQLTSLVNSISYANSAISNPITGLDSKLSKAGGSISGYLNIGGTLNVGGDFSTNVLNFASILNFYETDYSVRVMHLAGYDGDDDGNVGVICDLDLKVQGSTTFDGQVYALSALSVSSSLTVGDNINQPNSKALVGKFTTGVDCPIFQVWTNNVIYSGPYIDRNGNLGGETVQLRYGRGNDSGNAIIINGSTQSFDAHSLAASFSSVSTSVIGIKALAYSVGNSYTQLADNGSCGIALGAPYGGLGAYATTIYGTGLQVANGSYAGDNTVVWSADNQGNVIQSGSVNCSSVYTGTVGFYDTLNLVDNDYGERIASVCGPEGEEYGLNVYSRQHNYADHRLDGYQIGSNIKAFANVTLPSSQTVGQSFTTINLTKVTDFGNHFNDSTHIYTIPRTGVYEITTKIRINDGVPSGVSYGHGVSTSNTDGAWFLWGMTNSSRNGSINVRKAQFNYNDQIRMYAYVDYGSGLSVANAEMTVELVGIN